MAWQDSAEHVAIRKSGRWPPVGGFAAAWRPRRNGHGGEGSLPIALTILALTVIGLVPLIVLFVLP